MKLIINIDEDVYTRLFDKGIQDNEIAVDDVCEMARALRLGTPAIEEELKVKTRIESITETATEVTFTLTDGTKRVISIDDITSGSDMKIVTESGCYNVYQGG